MPPGISNSLTRAQESKSGGAVICHDLLRLLEVFSHAFTVKLVYGSLWDYGSKFSERLELSGWSDGGQTLRICHIESISRVHSSSMLLWKRRGVRTLVRSKEVTSRIWNRMTTWLMQRSVGRLINIKSVYKDIDDLCRDQNARSCIQKLEQMEDAQANCCNVQMLERANQIWSFRFSESQSHDVYRNHVKPCNT